MASAKKNWLAWLLLAGIGVAHFGFMALEMFRWPDLAQHLAGLSSTIANDTIPIGMNQGLYNGFLAAGLIWSLSWSNRPTLNRKLALFFVGCVLIAGIFGAATIKPPNFILLAVQAVPAAIALLLLWRLPPRPAA
jgi:putative membrane protein